METESNLKKCCKFLGSFFAGFLLNAFGFPLMTAIFSGLIRALAVFIPSFLELLFVPLIVVIVNMVIFFSVFKKRYTRVGFILGVVLCWLLASALPM